MSQLKDIGSLRGDVRELRHEMQLGFEQMRALLQKELRDQTRFFFVAWAVILAAIIGIYAR